MLFSVPCGGVEFCPRARRVLGAISEPGESPYRTGFGGCVVHSPPSSTVWTGRPITAPVRRQVNARGMMAYVESGEDPIQAATVHASSRRTAGQTSLRPVPPPCCPPAGRQELITGRLLGDVALIAACPSRPGHPERPFGWDRPDETMRLAVEVRQGAHEGDDDVGFSSEFTTQLHLGFQSWDRPRLWSAHQREHVPVLDPQLLGERSPRIAGRHRQPACPPTRRRASARSEKHPFRKARRDLLRAPASGRGAAGCLAYLGGRPRTNLRLRSTQASRSSSAMASAPTVTQPRIGRPLPSNGRTP